MIVDPTNPSIPSAQKATLQPCDPGQLLAELIRDFAPVGAAENILVAELARRAHNLQWWSDAACAVREAAVRTLGDLALPGIAATAEDPVITLAAGAACSAVDRAERTSSAQSPALTRGLKLLVDLQARRRGRESMAQTAALSAADHLQSEQYCVDYLASWRERNFLCPKCGSQRARFVPSRQCLECATCGSQSGLRVGTVMADSPLPLRTWCAAIRLVTSNPSIRTGQLKEQLRISRAATARSMAQKIRTALMADDRTARLAGLDREFVEAESSVCVQAGGGAQTGDGHAHELTALTTIGKQLTSKSSTESPA